jgi:tetratricopeptide (TPR) repeat protein
MLFAYKAAGISATTIPSRIQLIKCGTIIDADWVVSGNYVSGVPRWELNIELLNPKTGKTQPPIRAQAPDLCDAIDAIASNIVFAVDERLIDPQAQTIGLCHEANQEAWELVAKAAAAQDEGKSLVEVRQYLDKAVATRPQFSFARQLLAANLLSCEDVMGATEQGRRAVRDNPRLAPAHFTLGMVYLSQGLRSLAKREFEEATALDPGWPDPFGPLSDLITAEGNYDRALSILEKAESISPHDPAIHLRLCGICTHVGNRERALAEARAADNLARMDATFQEQLGDAYNALGAAPDALRHYEISVELQTSQVHEPKRLHEVRTKCDEIRLRLTPTFLAAAVPESITSLQLSKIVKQKLSATEERLVTIPFSSTPEMRGLATQLVVGAQSELAKARCIFDALTPSGISGTDFLGMTAAEAFTAWRQHRPSITCQDYALLYTALAREVGLRCFYVSVENDYTAKPVFHACAAVVLNEKVLLVDPVYRWFGVTHKRYHLEPDLHVIAAFLIQTHDPGKEAVGLHLTPDWAPAYFWVALSQIGRQQLKEAEATLSSGLSLDSASWLALYAKANLENAKGDVESAAKDLELCLKIQPDSTPAHFELAKAYASEGRLIEAREQYRKCLEDHSIPGGISKVLEQITQIEQKLSKSDYR